MPSFSSARAIKDGADTSPGYMFFGQDLALLQGVLGFLGQLVESKHMDPPETTGQADHQGLSPAPNL
jgi:hypothetical protein